MRPIRRLLIANRGEIAVRIALSAKAMGIVPLGIFSDADRDAYHLTFMDEAVNVGPGEARASYLDVENVLQAGRVLAADAIHPGYGFLSERAAFAQAAIDRGFTFVGPPPAAMEAMGDKAQAKAHARAAGVPIVPGYDGEEQSGERLIAEARAIGTPLIIKASAGGGGRGMRVVRDLATFAEALESARREARGAFADDRMLLERYIEEARHIEFQILADAHGRTLHLGERECSIQRRHQKVLEEAPSPALTSELRAAMGASAVAIAKASGYINAGTVEFIVTPASEFYFLEMNARLQVEHPVTEAVYGIDLVRKQLEIASGKPLDLEQHDLAARGWAIEARITAEDPQSGYLPATGTIERWRPPDGAFVRTDSGVTTGSVVSPYYDSMIAKLIVWGADRPAAIARLTDALERFEVRGIPTNLPLLLKIARDVTFRAGYTTTAFLVEHGNFLRADPVGEPEEAFVLGLGALLFDPRTWRVGSIGVPVVLRGAGRSVSVVASREGRDGTWILEGDLNGLVDFERRGQSIEAVVDGIRCSGEATARERGVDVVYDGARYQFEAGEPPQLGNGHRKAAGAGQETVASPMPGKIVSVAVRAGDTVAERDLLVVLEAMKMEHRIEAPHAGTVSRVHVETGTLVSGGATLVEIA